jgi:cytochrome P450
MPSLVDFVSKRKRYSQLVSDYISFLLVRHPKVMEKLRDEIASTCDATSNLTRDDLRRMPYLQNVLKESTSLKYVPVNLLMANNPALRLYPSVPVNTRTTIRTTVLPTGGGPDRTAPVLVPKGSAVAFSVYSMHRRPDLYGMDAELFRPERWDEDMPLQHDPVKAKWGYLPFHGGPRICLGSEYLRMLVSLRCISNACTFSGFCAHRSWIHSCTAPSKVPVHRASSR